MNADEKIAKKFLELLDLGEVVYEPYGPSTVPDFSVDNSIGIEVRKLNRYSYINGEQRAIEEKEISLSHSIVSILKEFDQNFQGITYGVFYSFQHPVPNTKRIKKALRKQLSDFLNLPHDIYEFKICDDRISINIEKVMYREGKTFLEYASDNLDNTAFWMSDVEESIRYCVRDKIEKTKNHRYKYKIWWLVLVNHISHNIENDERQWLKSKMNYCFDGVIIINPLNITDVFAISKL